MLAKHKRLLALLLSLVFTFSLIACGANTETSESSSESSEFNYAEVTSVDGGDTTKVTVGIAWRENKNSVYKATEDSIVYAGGESLILSQVLDYDLEYEDGKLASSMTDEHGILTDTASSLVKTNTYKNSNVETVLAGVNCVVFMGGEDISPSLFKEPQAWHGIEAETRYNATRDVSDYLLMSYCLDNDIPILCICRGMQMLAVVSGGSLIQDIETYYESCGVTYNYEHRFPTGTEDGDKSYTPHDVDIIDKSSVAYDLFGDKLEAVTSYHHQAVAYEGNEVCTGLKVTGTTTAGGVTLAEIIERTDKTYAIGYQFHPEVVIEKTLKGSDDKDDFYDASISRDIFVSFIKAGE